MRHEGSQYALVSIFCFWSCTLWLRDELHFFPFASGGRFGCQIGGEGLYELYCLA